MHRKFLPTLQDPVPSATSAILRVHFACSAARDLRHVIIGNLGCHVVLSVHRSQKLGEDDQRERGIHICSAD
eukprot:2862692-Prymnesium_polylepis.1